LGTKFRILVSCLFLLAWAGHARADSWAPPEVRNYLSANQSWRLTVHPRSFTNALDFFTDKVCGREPAGAPPRSGDRTARAVMEKSDGKGGWTRIWAAPLVNEVAPVEAIVSDDGLYSVTFDNWHSMGRGDNVVAIYDSRGQIVRSLTLTDFLPENYVTALPRSVSSTDWRGNPRFSKSGARLILPIVIPSRRYRNHPDTIDLSIDLATGRPTLPAGAEWAAASAAASAVNAAEARANRKQDARFEAPLLGPHSADERPWHDYLREAHYRLSPDWREASTWTTVLRSRSAPDYRKSEIWVAEALGPDSDGGDDRSFASPSQENLAMVFEAATAKLAPGALKDVRIYVAVTDAYRDRFVRALAHTGALFIQLDPTRPIPQRPDRLAARNSPPPAEPELCAPSRD
jgi:hypothetical protein